MFNLVGKVASVIFLVAVIAAGVILGASLLGSDEGGGRVDTFRYLLADRVTSEAADIVRNSIEAEQVCILPVEGDRTGEVTRLLEERIRELGYFELVKSRTVLKALRELSEADEGSPLGLAQILDLGRKVGADAVIAARLDSFVPPKRGEPAELDLSLKVMDVKTAKVVREERLQDRFDRKFSLSYFSAAMHESSGWMRLIIWVVLVCAAPFGTYFIVREVTRGERNFGNIVLLASYTLFDLLLALFLVGEDVTSDP